MCSVDSAWLRMDAPTNLMMVSGVLVFEERLPFERLLALAESRLLEFERFGQRVVEARGRLGAPRWEPDPGFDLRRHLVRAELPAPADEAALQRMVSRLMSEPLDPGHPLWQFHLVEEFQGGSALICRFHHCIGDGLAMVHVMLSLTDRTAEAACQGSAAAPEAGTGLDAETIGRGVGRAVGRAANAVSDLVMHPGKVRDAAARGSSAAQALGKLALMPADPPTPFKGPLGVEKRAVWSRPIDVRRIKAIGRRTGATVNDLLLAAVAGALRRYLLQRWQDVEGLEIRAVVPVNLRPPEQAHELGNRFGLVFLALPLGAEEPLERIFELKKRMDAIKDSPEALVAFQILKGMGISPAPVFELVLSQFGKKASAVMTNVMGPTEPVYFSGVRVRQTMFWVPRAAGLGLGVSILSYDGKVWLGIATDAGLVPDPETILEGFHEEFDEMTNLVHLVEEQGT